MILFRCWCLIFIESSNTSVVERSVRGPPISAAGLILKGCPEARSRARECGMVDAPLSEEDAPLRDFTEDAEETGAAGKFYKFSLFRRDGGS